MTTTTKPVQNEGFILPELIVTGNLSPESQEIIEHFGLEAPKLLNDYSCAVEDALIEQVKKNQEMMDMIQILLTAGETAGVDLMAIINQNV